MVEFLLQDNSFFIVLHFKTMQQCRLDSYCSTNLQPLPETQDNISLAWNIKLDFEGGSLEKRKELTFSWKQRI